MMMNKHFVHLNLKVYALLLLAGLLGCNTQPKEDNSKTAATEATTNRRVQDFPRITLVGDRELKMDAYSLHFTLTHPEGLNAHPNHLIPWIDPATFTESSGTFLTYFRTNAPTRLDQPNIRLSYIQKQPAQPSADALIAWVENQFLNTNGAQKLDGLETISTAASKDAKLIHLHLPGQGGRADKYMVFAYIEGSEDYMLGLNLTAINAADYEQTKSAFYELLKNYRE